MNSKTAKLITPERVMELLDCYGADPESWPDDERTTALALIQNSTQLKNLQNEARELDHFLAGGEMKQDAVEPVDMKLVSRITANLPAQDKPVKRITQDSRRAVKRSLFDPGSWTGMIAASLAVFAITVSIMELQSTPGSRPQSSVSQAELDYWMWQQVTGETENEDEEPLTMMVLFEPE
ncbi:hypothetical protein [Kaarinaea lacus]